MTKLFHYVHYLQIVFAIPSIYYIFHGSILRTENYMDEIALGVFFMGISFAFGSMGDIRKISAKEKKLFSNPKKFKEKVRGLVVMGIIITLVSLFFISIKWLYVGDGVLAEQYYNLGINCLPLVIANFFELKQTNDKKYYFDLEKK